MIDTSRLALKAKAYGLALPAELLTKLDIYAKMLAEWNKKINLTAIIAPEAVEDRHFIDSLLFAMQPQVTGKVADVGSGAGFPGLVAKLYKPNLDVTLIEPTGKRCIFLEKVAEEIGVELTVLKERAEEASRKKYRETFDVAVARAVAALPQLCEYCLPLVKLGGIFIAMKGPDAEQEVQQSARALQLLGGEVQAQQAFTLPDGSGRTLITIQKVAPTPSVYPRNGGKISKKPL